MFIKTCVYPARPCHVSFFKLEKSLSSDGFTSRLHRGSSDQDDQARRLSRQYCTIIDVLLFCSISSSSSSSSIGEVRHIVALLAMMNLGLWLVDTFELQVRINMMRLVSGHLTHLSFRSREPAWRRSSSMVRSSGSQFRGSLCPSAYSSGVQYTSTTTKPTPSSGEVVESNINIAMHC